MAQSKKGNYMSGWCGHDNRTMHMKLASISVIKSGYRVACQHSWVGLLGCRALLVKLIMWKWTNMIDNESH